MCEQVSNSIMTENNKRRISTELANFVAVAPKELRQLKEDLAQCREDAAKLVDENKRLFDELKQQIRLRLEAVDAKKKDSTMDELIALRDERDSAIEARDKAMMLFQNAVAEVNRVDRELKSKAEYISPEDFEAAVLKLKQEHLLQVESIERQLQITRKELRSASSSVHQLTWRLLRDGATTLDDDQVKIRDVLHAMENLQSQYNDLELTHQNMVSKVELKEKQLEKLRRHCGELEQKVDHFKDRTQRLEVQMGHALQHAENSVVAAELAVAERNTMSTHVQDLQRVTEQLRKQLKDKELTQEQQLTSQVENIRLNFEREQTELKTQLLLAQEKCRNFDDDLSRVCREKQELNERLSKFLEDEKIEREGRLREEKQFKESTIQEIMDRKKELLEERIRREASEKRLNEVADEKERFRMKLADAEAAFEQLKEETRRIQSSMVELKNEGDKLAEERLRVEQALRMKQEEENEGLQREIERLTKKITLLEEIHNKVENEFKKRMAKAQKKVIEYKKTVEILEERMRKQAGLI